MTDAHTKSIYSGEKEMTTTQAIAVDQIAIERFFYDLSTEFAGARAKFPQNRNQTVALMEEVGELANALLEHSYGKGTPQQVYKEAIQVAAMAMRVALEGDREFPYVYDYACYRDFQAPESKEIKK